MNTKQQTWKTTILASLITFILALGLAVKWNWIGPTQAQKPQWIFGGTTPSSFADLAQRVQNTVVNISTTKTLRLRRSPFYRFQEEFFGRQPVPSPQVKRPNSLGSGFILDQAGHILTNHHVISGADEIQVTLSDGRTFPAQTIGTDPKSDLAVIKVKTTASLPTVQLGDSDELKIGDWVVAIGNPFGLGHTVTSGILSAKGRVIGAGPYDNFLQTDASINPGNSGGPLFNLKGEVIGVNTAIIAGGQGIGFAIPINMAKVAIPQLIKGGKVKRGYLGIGLQEMTPQLAKSFGFSKPEGAIVAQVYRNSPAHRAGIQAGDVILSFNEKKIRRQQDLPLFVSQSGVGSQAKVELFRKGKTKTVEVRLGSLDQAGTQPVISSLNDPSTAPKLGISVKDIGPRESQQYGIRLGNGVLVTQVEDNSPAAGVGLQAGDVILEVNDQAITSAEAFLKISQNLQKGKIVRLFVRRGPLTSYFAFPL